MNAQDESSMFGKTSSTHHQSRCHGKLFKKSKSHADRLVTLKIRFLKLKKVTSLKKIFEWPSSFIH